MNKSHILEEIRRIAAENGGIAPGREVFTSTTGIKQYDWGRFWANWSEAVVEAGFAPNQLQRAYSKDELLAAFASLAREIGRLPSQGHVRVKAHADPGFPNYGTFTSRLGPMRELVQQLAEFCRANESCSDVLAFCETYQPAKRKSKEAPSPDVEIGSIYLLRSGRFHKIGRSNAAGRREYELAIQLPEKTRTIHLIRTDDPVGIEAYWHKRFDAKRKNGEWFELDAADVAAFKRRKFM